MQNNELIREKINILYTRLKVKFDDMMFYTENINNTDKIRILIVDINYIFNSVYGYSHSITDNHMELFDEKYIDLHIINFLSLLAHYRRFFYSRCEAKRNYLFVYRTNKNVKRPWLIFDKILLKLKNYTDFIQFFYVNDNVKKPRLFFKEVIEQHFIKLYSKDIDINFYVLNRDDLLKSFIYSISNKYFNNSNVSIFTHEINKFITKKYENMFINYKYFIDNNDKIIQKSFKEIFYKLIIINQLDVKFKKLRINKKIDILNKCLVEKTNNIDNIIDKDLKIIYKSIIEELMFNDMYKEIVKQEFENDKVKLYDKTLLTSNMNIEFDNLQNITDWLLQVEN